MRTKNNITIVLGIVLALLGAGVAVAATRGGGTDSGSGPTVFGLARSLDHARQIRSRISRAGWACWAVRTNSGPAIRVSR